MPSLFLLLSFETFINQIKHAVSHANAIKTFDQLTSELQTKQSELDTMVRQKQQELDTFIQSKQMELDRLNSEADRLSQSIEQSHKTLADLKQELKQVKPVQHSGIEQAKQVKAEQDASAIERRRSKLLNILTTESDIGVSALADRLNISRGTVYTDLRALSDAGQIIKNGNGWEVQV